MSVDWSQIEEDTDHRPWPLPDSPWLMTMSWVELLAAHWPVEPHLLEEHIPPGLTLDTFDGNAWLSLVPFEMDNTISRGLTWWPRPMKFLELNLRTYVTVEGRKPGVWFFSLDAASRLAVAGARTLFHLPYFNADMEMSVDADRVDYFSRRTHRGAVNAQFRGSYGPTGPPQPADPGTVDHWLMERYCLYAEHDGSIYRSDVHHCQWPLQPAKVEIEANTTFDIIGVELPKDPSHCHYARGIDVLGWGPQKVDR